MKPKDELPLALRTAYLIMHRRSEAVFAQRNITADQFVLLATLSGGQAMTQRKLAARMPSDPSTVLAMLVLLEKQGLVSRSIHPTDGRTRTVRLTRAGAKKYQTAWNAGQSVRDQMVQSNSSKQVKILLACLLQLSQSLEGQNWELEASSSL